MRSITFNVYSFDELEPKAKRNALDNLQLGCDIDDKICEQGILEDTFCFSVNPEYAPEVYRPSHNQPFNILWDDADISESMERRFLIQSCDFADEQIGYESMFTQAIRIMLVSPAERRPATRGDIIRAAWETFYESVQAEMEYQLTNDYKLECIDANPELFEFYADGTLFV